MRRARCPKDGGRILEVAMPDVVCEKCGTTYILAMQIGTFMLHTKLIEKQPAQPQVIMNKEVTQREIVKVPCKYCGTLNNLATDKFCSGCGAPVK